MKIKALRKFRDIKENVIRNKNDEFIVSKDRFKELVNNLNEWSKKHNKLDLVDKWVKEIK